jgi:5-methylthioadenosine/S-adenosylhomocysteine deaminase
MIAGGLTTVQHLHSRVPGTAEAMIAAAGQVIGAHREIGMCACYSLALRDQNRQGYEDDAACTARLPAALRPSITRHFARFTRPPVEQAAAFEATRRLTDADGEIAAQLEPANVHWLSDRALELTGELSARHDLPMRIHLLERPCQKVYAERRSRSSALAGLHRLGLTGPRAAVGHGVWMTEDDIALRAHSSTRICHNCSANLRLKSGIAPMTASAPRASRWHSTSMTRGSTTAVTGSRRCGGRCACIASRASMRRIRLRHWLAGVRAQPFDRARGRR